MIRRLRPLLALALCACPAPGAQTGAPAPRRAAYHGVVVWLGPSTDTVRVSFTPEWRWTPAGADTVWAFARARSGDGWVHGRMQGDSLVWGITSMAGDAGSSAEFAGVPEPDGTVRGCLRPARLGWAPDASQHRAAFILRPVGLPAPAASDAPVQRCG